MAAIGRLPHWATGVIGGVVIIALWWISAVTIFQNVGAAPGGAIPTPGAVVSQLIADGFAFYWPHILATTTEAGIGFVWGNAFALLLAALVLIFPRIEKTAMQVAVITYCIPIVAIGPIAYIVIGPSSGGGISGTAVFLAALSVFFTTVVGSLVGLKAADAASLDIITVYGGNRLTQLRRVRLIAGLPSVLNALQVAAPAAFLGAVLGEYMGGAERGLGVALLAAGSSANVDRVWGLAIISGLVAGLGYLMFGLIARVVAPWSDGRSAR